MTDTIPERVLESPEVYDSMDAVDERKFLRKARRLASRLPFVRHAVAMWHALGDPATPVTARAVLVGAIVYFVLPADFVPDFLAGLGFTDDIAVLWAAFRTVRDNIRPEHYAKARTALGELDD